MDRPQTGHLTSDHGEEDETKWRSFNSSVEDPPNSNFNFNFNSSSLPFHNFRISFNVILIIITSKKETKKLQRDAENISTSVLIRLKYFHPI
jgi:uncharacterized membrane protein